MELNLESAKKFAKEEYLSKLSANERKFVLMHIKSVEKCAVLLAKGKNVDVNLLRIAAWLHDVGRASVDEGHGKESVMMAQKEFGKLDARVVDCLQNHGAKDIPKTKEGKIMQFADKMSILDPKSFIFYFKIPEGKNPEFYTGKMNKLLKNAADFEF